MDLKKKVFILAIVLFSFFFLLRTADWLRADVAYAQGRGLASAGYLLAAQESLEKATRLWPEEPAYHRELAAVYARLAQVSADEKQEPLVAKVATESQVARDLNPHNLLTLKSLIPTYFALSQLDPSYSEAVAEVVQQATDLCPTDPTLWYFQSLVSLDQGDAQAAIVAAARALELKPDYPEASALYEELLSR